MHGNVLTIIREIAAIAGLIIVALFYIKELKQWKTGSQLVNSAQKILRTTSIIILSLILLMILAGDDWLGSNLLSIIKYWTVCFLLAIVLIIISLIDLYNVNRSSTKEIKDILRKTIKTNDKDSG
jgi:undecaprenyl pyrophosphate phosphatase UppP